MQNMITTTTTSQAAEFWNSIANYKAKFAAASDGMAFEAVAKQRPQLYLAARAVEFSRRGSNAQFANESSETQFANEAAQIQKARGLNYAKSINAAARENPELARSLLFDAFERKKYQVAARIGAQFVNDDLTPQFSVVPPKFAAMFQITGATPEEFDAAYRGNGNRMAPIDFLGIRTSLIGYFSKKEKCDAGKALELVRAKFPNLEAAYKNL